MLETERVSVIFADARFLYADALAQLEQGSLRNAAEKAWGTTKRATDALLLARTGQEVNRTSQTSGGIRALGQENRELASLRSRYSDRAHYLHGDCFYDGQCEPEEFVAGLIRETIDYIRDAERLAGAQ